MKTLIFKVVYLLKMCPILVSSVHNFGRSDDDIIQWKNAYFPWFDAQLDQQILDGIYTRFPSDQNSSSRQMKKKLKKKMGRQKREKGKDAEHSLTAVKKDWLTVRSKGQIFRSEILSAQLFVHWPTYAFSYYCILFIF